MRHTDPLACDGLASLRMLLSVASMCGIRELLRQFADRADKAEMISLWPSSHTSATAASVEGVPRFPFNRSLHSMQFAGRTSSTETGASVPLPESAARLW